MAAAEDIRRLLHQFAAGFLKEPNPDVLEQLKQILQAEDSVRYRTNIGLAEVTGKPAGVDVLVNLPDSKVTPVVHVNLAANDFQQFNVFRALGLENVYNARVTVRVTDGDGRVTAYGSVVDMLTSDPTYVPAQQ